MVIAVTLPSVAGCSFRCHASRKRQPASEDAVGVAMLAAAALAE
jgi:hypothetical protein